MMKGFILIDVRTGELREAVQQLRRVDGVVEAYMIFGAFDAIAVVEAEDLNKLGQILSTSIHPIPGVVDTVTYLAVDQ